MRNHLLSQHFLKSPRLALMLIGHSNLKKRDTVVEIGAGSGVITSALARRVSHVIAIEPDHATAAKLRTNLAKRNITNVTVVEQDFLDYVLPTTPYKVFSNPPFHLSSKIIHKFIESPVPPDSFYLILQKQFALKLLNTDRHYTSQLGLQLISSYHTKIRFPLKSTDFTPPPAVPTVLFEAKRITVSAPVDYSSSKNAPDCRDHSL
ncbi:methyltransferase [Candidatus Saccharibacteria bacterium]|nr:methyltransferase [Candidatus Saccharibacteria bacterium]